MKRKEFLKMVGVTAAATAVLPSIPLSSFAKRSAIPSKRPPADERRFRSEVIDNYIQDMQGKIADETLAWMFGNCFPNTLDTTVFQGTYKDKPDTFVITGDIHACWLRDSSAQVWPYMDFLTQDENLAAMVKGLINRHSNSVNLDPYANAFCMDEESFCAAFPDDMPRAKNGVFERKWEVDSLCYVIRLSHRYWKETKDTSFMDNDWLLAMDTIVETFKTEQRKDGKTPYSYSRCSDRMTDTSFASGLGRPFHPTGAICSSFRPSDDSTMWNFLVPSNLFAISMLKKLEEMLKSAGKGDDIIPKARTLREEVEKAMKEYAVVKHRHFGKIYCYEFDGLGNHNFMDDANVPSLLSASYLDALDHNDHLYKNTRKFALSDKNGWFFKGTAAEGIGGPHTGYNKIWPMSIAMRGITSDSEKEVEQCIKYLLTTHDNTGFMHESFNMDDPSDYTREWFAWANGLFGEFIIHISRKYPHLLKKKYV
ncbi:MAG: glycoside hydrolase family 125 protein [Hyphomicrobiales bacterium]